MIMINTSVLSILKVRKTLHDIRCRSCSYLYIDSKFVFLVFMFFPLSVLTIVKWIATIATKVFNCWRVYRTVQHTAYVSAYSIHWRGWPTAIFEDAHCMSLEEKIWTMLQNSHTHMPNRAHTLWQEIRI